MRTVGKLGFSGHPMIEHFKFVKSHTQRTPKMTIPSPSALLLRAASRVAVSEKAYPDLDEFFDDLGQTYKKAIRAFYDAGCRYLQLDEVFMALLCDPEQHKALHARGDDPDKMPGIYAGVINAALEGPSGRHDDHDASVPRQFPLHLRRQRAATSRSPRSCSAASTCTATSWNTTPSAPAASSRCDSCRRTRPWCSD